jgi:hypothetical protein
MKIESMDQQTVNDLVGFLSKNFGKSVTIEIDCDGGNTYYANLMADYIEKHSMVTISVVGSCKSAALYPFIAGAVREATSASQFMLHNATWDTDYIISDLVSPYFESEKDSNGLDTGKFIKTDKYKLINYTVSVVGLMAHVERLIPMIKSSQEYNVKIAKFFVGKLPFDNLIDTSYREVIFGPKEAHAWGIISKINP